MITVPNVSPADIEATISSEHYFTAADGAGRLSSTSVDVGADGLLPSQLQQLTFCVLVTKNGHTVTGQSYCQDPAKNVPVEGRTWARADAIGKLQPMVVYAARGAA